MIVPALPLAFKPIYKETIWGGNAFASRFKRPVSPDLAIGESWEIVSRAADQSIVDGGPLAGTPLNRLIEAPLQTLLGKTENFGIFPLLVKFIDAKERLSVQVHPDDLQARANGWGEFGKTECWYILDAKENARLVVGFNRDISRAEINRAIETGTLGDYLNFIPIKKGDVLNIPAGTVHAILEGALLYEIQQTSDTTLRLYDWGRVDATGKPRTLHVRDALLVLDRTGSSGCRILPLTVLKQGIVHSYCIANRYFALEHYAFRRDMEIILPAKQSFRVLTVISGTVTLHCPHGNLTLIPATTVLLPAALHEVRAAGSADAELLITSVPDLYKEIISPLRDAGVDDDTIAALGGCAAANDLRRFLHV